MVSLPAMLLFFALFVISGAITCYRETNTSKPYDTIEKSMVESRRACELRCDGNTSCVGFSIASAGSASHCVLLEISKKANTICAAPTTIFLQQTTGCARTNITAEFGVDPCIDERVDAAIRGVGIKGPFCEAGRDKQYIIRAVGADGNRITLDNENAAKIVKLNDMWQYEWSYKTVQYMMPIIAATCVRAGAVKCPCKPLGNLTIVDYSPTYPARVDIINPCNNTGSYLYYDQVKTPTYESLRTDSNTVFVTCQAGMWMFYRQSDNNVWGVNGLSCYK